MSGEPWRSWVLDMVAAFDAALSFTADRQVDSQLGHRGGRPQRPNARPGRLASLPTDPAR